MRCAESEKDIQENFTFNLIFSWLLEKYVEDLFNMNNLNKFMEITIVEFQINH